VYCSDTMRWVLVATGLIASTAFGQFGASVTLGPAWGHVGNFPPGRAIPLVPTTNYTNFGYGYGYGRVPIMPIAYPIYYYQQVQQPQPPPPPQQVIIEREVIIERPAPAPVAPPPPQVIVIEQPAPVVAQAPPPPPPPPAPVEPPKPLAPRTPGPDVYSWTDSDGVVHYSTRAPAAGVKAKKLATLAK